MPSLADIVDEVVRTDVLIAGSEGAGARAAISAHDAGASVTCVTKGFVGKSGATLTADADIDVDSRTCIKLFNLPGSALAPTRSRAKYATGVGSSNPAP